MKNSQNSIITIDGSQGEGGGQVLRTSLSLSMVTGKAFKIINIRANRQKPGLKHQHLTAVKAAAEICDAHVTGAELNSQELSFIPGKPKADDYHFSIGTAGSTTLVAQTVIPALMLADGASTLTLEGGTHNMHAPPFDFIQDSYLPILEKMGATIEATLQSYGFYPAGKGKITFRIKPTKKLQPIKLIDRGKQKNVSAEILLAKLNESIGWREAETIKNLMSWPPKKIHIRNIENAASPGNVVLLKLAFENVTETIASFGRIGVRAEKVATQACKKAQSYLQSNAAVGIHLADQLLLPFALAGSGTFTTLIPSLHTKTNIEVIKQFTPCDVAINQLQENTWQVSIAKKTI